jgi:hypothetical protein
VAAADPGNVIHFGDSNTRAAQMYQKVGVILATEGGVSFFCRTKVVFHSQMNLNCSAQEPAPATFGKLRRFRQLGHTENIKVEPPGSFFSSDGHSQLDVIDGGEKSVCHGDPQGSSEPFLKFMAF